MKLAPEVRKLVKAALDAGWVAVETKKGVTLRAPDGVATVGFHRTPSDHRSTQNLRSSLRRNGVAV